MATVAFPSLALDFDGVLSEWDAGIFTHDEPFVNMDAASIQLDFSSFDPSVLAPIKYETIDAIAPDFWPGTHVPMQQHKAAAMQFVPSQMQQQHHMSGGAHSSGSLPQLSNTSWSSRGGLSVPDAGNGLLTLDLADQADSHMHVPSLDDFCQKQEKVAVGLMGPVVECPAMSRAHSSQQMYGGAHRTLPDGRPHAHHMSHAASMGLQDGVVPTFTQTVFSQPSQPGMPSDAQGVLMAQQMHHMPPPLARPGSPAESSGSGAVVPVPMPALQRAASNAQPMQRMQSMPALAPPAPQQQAPQAHTPRVRHERAEAAGGSGCADEPVRTRAEALERYRQKKANRMYTKKIRYQLRKINADRRPRIKGRFVKKSELAQYYADQAAAQGVVGGSGEGLAEACGGDEQGGCAKRARCDDPLMGMPMHDDLDMADLDEMVDLDDLEDL